MNMENNVERAKINPPRGSGYNLARHHAWGGLAMLSVLGGVRLLFPELPAAVWIPAASLLVAYILVWLFLTYRYRSSLRGESPVSSTPGAAGYKLEKKRIKAAAKAAKKKR
ncbi:MAG: hypothetical protein V1789_10580 [PVC group bacterium]